MIEGYGFFPHVLPRMLPTLAFVAIASLVWLVPLGAAGYGRWVLLAVILASTVVVSTVLSLFVRRLPVFTRNRTVAVLVGYALVPVVVPVLQRAIEDTPDSDPVQLALFFAGVFAATWFAVTYGLASLLRAAIRHTVEDLRNSVNLLGRALPPLLFVTLFLFFTGELWQAVNRLGWARLSLIVALFVAITVLAAAARLREEIGRVEHDLTPSVLSAACGGTPLAGVSLTEPVRARKLTGRQLRNLLVMLAIRQLVQAAVVGLALFGFFVVLGLIVVLPETAEQWIGGSGGVREVAARRAGGVVAQRHPVRGVRQHVLRGGVDERRRAPQAVLRPRHRAGGTHAGRPRRVPGGPARRDSGDVGVTRQPGGIPPAVPRKADA